MKYPAAVFIFAISIAAFGCERSAPVEPAFGEGAYGYDMSITSLGIDTTVVLSGVLSDTVEDGLRFMVEEEKVARDVYLSLAERWGSRPFGNIAASEQRHMDIVRALLKHYGVEDPSAENVRGIFSDPVLQQLHDQLLEQGLRSATDAYQVGKLIEETDIADLDKHLAELTTESDIRRAYENLRAASVRHLNAFTRRL